MRPPLPTELETGIPLIDQQHSELLQTAGQLMDELTARKNPATALRIHSFLLDFVTKHFATEERAMTRVAYSDHLAHAASHHSFYIRLLELDEEIRLLGAGQEMVTDVGFLLPDLLMRHVQEHDLPMARFLRDHVHEAAEASLDAEAPAKAPLPLI